jgi:hypothetical protein
MNDQNIPTPPKNLPGAEVDVKTEPANTDVSMPVPPPIQMPTPTPVPPSVQQPVLASVPPPAPPQNKALTAQANMAKEQLFSFKGHDMRSGDKKPTVVEAKPIPPGGSLQAEADALTPKPKPQMEQVPVQAIPSVTATAPTIKTPSNPIRPPTTPPIIRSLGTAPAPNAPVKPGENRPKALRTYESDVAEVLSQNRTSTASIAIAESRKNTGEDQIGEATESSHAGKKILLVIISLLLLCGGAFGAYYLYSISPLAPSPQSAPVVQPAPSLVPSDTKAVIPIDGMNLNNIMIAVRAEIAKPQTANTIKEIILVQTKNSQHFRVAEPDMANIIDIGAPDILLRALADNWMLGVYADGNGVKTTFVVATVDYFQNAFTGMLQWESLMADDLKMYLYTNTPTDITTAPLPQASVSSSTTSTSATSTSTIPFTQIVQSPILRGSFKDRIIDNKDVREFVTTDGNTLFLYSFIDNTKLVITGSEATLSNILNRLEQQAFVR